MIPYCLDLLWLHLGISLLAKKAIRIYRQLIPQRDFNSLLLCLRLVLLSEGLLPFYRFIVSLGNMTNMRWLLIELCAIRVIPILLQPQNLVLVLHNSLLKHTNL